MTRLREFFDSRISVVDAPSTDSNTDVSIGMKFKINLESAVYFTKLSVYLAWTWPPLRIASKWDTVKHDVAWIICIFNVLCLLLPLLAAIYVYQSNSVIVTQSACFACGGFNYIIKTLLYRVRRKRMQILIHEMEEFFKNPQSHEKNVLHCYLDRCWIFQAVITLMNYVNAVAMICVPLLFPQPLPTFAVYPFSVDSGFGKYLAYSHQAFVGFLFTAGLVTDCQIALMMWYAGARLEILSEEFKGVLNANQVPSFVEKHQRLISYADEVSDTMCYVALTTSVTCGIGTVMSSMQLISNVPFGLKLQYGPMIMICMLNLFVCAWPAENLLKACDLMARAVYNTPWIDMSTKLRKDVLFILWRSQRPVKVSVGGFLPILSFRFYALFLSTAASYFTTLRAVVAINSED